MVEIDGMEMPESCANCDMSYRDDYFSYNPPLKCPLVYCPMGLNENEKHKDCPLRERQTGRWRHYERMITCSVCNTEYYDEIMEYLGDDVPKYCPSCGAKMEEGE